MQEKEYYILYWNDMYKLNSNLKEILNWDITYSRYESVSNWAELR
jgi:hypothetical protein